MLQGLGNARARLGNFSIVTRYVDTWDAGGEVKGNLGGRYEASLGRLARIVVNAWEQK